MKFPKQLEIAPENIQIQIQENIRNEKMMEEFGQELEQIAIIKHDQNIEIKIQENIGNDKLMEVLESEQIANIIQDQNIEIKIQENIGNDKLTEAVLEDEPEPEQFVNIKQVKDIGIEIQKDIGSDKLNEVLEDEYSCGFCNEKFNQIQNLRNHIKNAHQKTESFRFELSGFPCEMIVKS